MDALLLWSMLAGELLLARLLREFIRRKLWRIRPCFFALCLLLLVSWGLAFTAWEVPKVFHNYAAIYWGTAYLEYAFGFAAMVETLRKWNARILIGLALYYGPPLIGYAHTLPAWSRGIPVVCFIGAVLLWMEDPLEAKLRTSRHDHGVLRQAG